MFVAAGVCSLALGLSACNPDPRTGNNGNGNGNGGGDVATDGAIVDAADDGGPGGDDGGPIDGESIDGQSDQDGTSGTDGDGGNDPGDTSPDISCSGNLTPCNGECVDLQNSNDHCGQCGRSCGTLGSCSSGVCECPQYHDYCPDEGSCVPTNLDPDNCGSCNNECSGDNVCSGGQCQAECPTGLDACPSQNECVDLDTSNDNCGTCGNACPSGEACVNGTCNTAEGSPTIPGSNKCQGGGPPINVGVSDSTDTCTGDVAQDTFRWGLCSCDSITLKNNSVFDAYDSTLGPYVPLGGGGSVGTNGTATMQKNTVVTGSLWASGTNSGTSSTAATLDGVEVYEQLHVGADYRGEGGTVVEGDGYVEGDITTGSGGATFEQTLFVNSGSAVPQQIDNNTTVDRSQTVSVDDPCELCDPQDQLPIDQIVADHDMSAPSNNDNDLINLDPDVLNQPGQDTRLDLPCGRYFLNEIDADGSRISIVAHGRTALFIDGDVNLSNSSVIKPTPSAELDVFVTGDMIVNGGVELGSPAYPAFTRAYVGGPNGFQLMNDATIGANIYAIPGGFTAMNNPEIFGAVYAENFTTMNNAEIHYDRETLDAGESCPDPDDDPPGGDTGPDAGLDGGLDGGTPSDADVSDPDGTSSMDTSTDADAGGGGGTCSQQGESCMADSDCCSPLVCNSGTCEASSCNFLYESCTDNSDCCSENCTTTSDGKICFGG